MRDVADWGSKGGGSGVGAASPPMQTQSETPTLPSLPHYPHSHKPSSQLAVRMRKVIRDSLSATVQRAKRRERGAPIRVRNHRLGLSWVRLGMTAIQTTAFLSCASLEGEVQYRGIHRASHSLTLRLEIGTPTAP